MLSFGALLISNGQCIPSAKKSLAKTEVDRSFSSGMTAHSNLVTNNMQKTRKSVHPQCSESEWPQRWVTRRVLTSTATSRYVAQEYSRYTQRGGHWIEVHRRHKSHCNMQLSFCTRYRENEEASSQHLAVTHAFSKYGDGFHAISALQTLEVGASSVLSATVIQYDQCTAPAR